MLSSPWLVLLAVTLVAAVLRLYALDRWPPGLYRDEAYNGLDALDVLSGSRPVFFESNNGREPLFIYLASIAVAWAGRSPQALRVVAALLGTLTIPATYLLVRELLGAREALLSAVVTAGTFWHLNLSRVAFRAVSLPLLLALCLWLYGRAVRRKSWLDYLLCGALLGLSLYSYLPARFTPVTLALLTLRELRRGHKVPWNGLGILCLGAILVGLPMVLYGWRNLDTLLARSAQVSILNPTINQGDLAGTLARHVVATLGMFNWHGDFIPRHNLPHRPVFDVLMGLFFLAGLLIAARRSRSHSSYALLLTQLGVMLLPTVLAEDAPHFLRSVGVLPVACVFPAIGLSATLDWLVVRMPRTRATAVLSLVIGLSLFMTIRDYFGVFVHSEDVYYHFETGAAELASSVNAYLGQGWSGRRAETADDRAQAPARVVLLDPRLWSDWPSLRFLVPYSPDLALLSEGAAAPRHVDEMRLIVWPYRDYLQHLSLLPTGRQITVREGPWERGDLEAVARLLAVAFEASDPEPPPIHLGTQFEHGIELLGFSLRSAEESTAVRLYWRANAPLDADYTVFVHWWRGDTRIAQHDSYPALGYYPTHLWRAGDTVVDEHTLEAVWTTEAGDTLSVGLYQLESMERLKVLDASGAAVSDVVSLRLP